LFSKVNVQLLRKPVQVIIGTKSMDVPRQFVGTPPAAETANALEEDGGNARKADPERIAPKANQEKIA
jgi:hypothetical protein